MGGTWEVQGDCLKQISPGLDDPSKAVLVLDDRNDLMTDVVFTAKLRLDNWQDSELARAGIGLCCDPRNGHGLNLVFNRGRLRFVHDYVAWSPGSRVLLQTGKWYWMKLCKTAGELAGKAWLDGTPEPAGWTTSWRRFRRGPERLSGAGRLLGRAEGGSAGLLRAIQRRDA